MPTASDIDLVQASRGGDDEAFEELYRRYHARISAFVRGMVRDDSRAEDVTQEAFVSALRQMRRTEREIQFKPWIYEIAKNKAIDAYRRASRSPEVSFEPHGELEAQRGVGPGAPHAPEACLMDRERFDNFRGALDELSDTHHRIICLYELEGLSYQEIGARMQLSSAAVESTLFRARRKLEHEYEQRDTGRRCRLVRAAIARLAEGLDSASDRRHLDRHARSCWSCRRCAHELGLKPSSPRTGLRGVGALLPLPAFLRRFLGGGPQGAGSGHSAVRDAVGALGAPGLETAAQGAQKAAVVGASAIAIGGGGATLGGVGPLAVDGDRTAKQSLREGQARAPRKDAQAPAFGERSGSLRDPGPSRAADSAARRHHRHRREGASRGDSRSARRGAPAAAGRSTAPSSRPLPRLDPGRLLPSLPRRDTPVLPQGGAIRLEGGTLPKPPDLPRVPVDLVPSADQVQGLAPDVAVETPDLGAALPQP